MEMYGSMQTMLSSGNVWLLLLFMSLTALLPDIVLRAVQDSASPLYNEQVSQPKKNILEQFLFILLPSKCLEIVFS